jgi:hypothetical protein
MLKTEAIDERVMGTTWGPSFSLCSVTPALYQCYIGPENDR